jgi:uncharacterized FlaG/YvyC family protein
MSMDFNIKPVGAPVATPIAPPVSEAVDRAVATQLPPRQSVTAVNANVRARVDANVTNASLSNQVVIDRAAGSIVYQVIDSRTSLVVKQFPDEAILRRRAYFRTLDLTRDAPTRLLATDVKA